MCSKNVRLSWRYGLFSLSWIFYRRRYLSELICFLKASSPSSWMSYIDEEVFTTMLLCAFCSFCRINKFCHFAPYLPWASVKDNPLRVFPKTDTDSRLEDKTHCRRRFIRHFLSMINFCPARRSSTTRPSPYLTYCVRRGSQMLLSWRRCCRWRERRADDNACDNCIFSAYEYCEYRGGQNALLCLSVNNVDSLCLWLKRAILVELDSSYPMKPLKQ